jgi:hypothetical protein
MEREMARLGLSICHILAQGWAGDVPVFTTIPPIFSAEPEELEDLASTAKHVLVLGLSYGGYKDSVTRTISLTLLLFQDNHLQQQNTPTQALREHCSSDEPWPATPVPAMALNKVCRCLLINELNTRLISASMTGSLP